MQLELNDEERNDLSNALDARLLSLRNELAHTDDRHYRQTVRATLDRLEGIADRLAQEPRKAGPQVVDIRDRLR
jgi:hypothetical protein